MLMYRNTLGAIHRYSKTQYRCSSILLIAQGILGKELGSIVARQREWQVNIQAGLVGSNSQLLLSCYDCRQCSEWTDFGYVIVIVQLSGIYGSKPTKSEGDSPRTRFVYVTINPR